MIEISNQEVMNKKWRKQFQIKQLKYHAYGAAVHLGKISPGCRMCFSKELGGGVQIGNKCMCNCSYCYYNKERKEMHPKEVVDIIADHFAHSLFNDWKPLGYSFQSAGETLSYLDELEKVAGIHASVEDRFGISIYHHLYTNGILIDKKVLERLKKMRVDEIRFHISASNFSEKVINNMYLAKEAGFTITVEEPSYPLNRDKLFKFLEKMDDIGCAHLNLVEVQLTAFNFDAISEEYQEGRYYKDYYYHLYDEGLVYDIMEEVASKGYSFSVLDCNNVVERYRQGPEYEKIIDLKSIEGMCTPFAHNSPRSK